jgi:hypothetical protein
MIFSPAGFDLRGCFRVTSSVGYWLQRPLNIFARSKKGVSKVNDPKMLIGDLPHRPNLIHHQFKVHE